MAFWLWRDKPRDELQIEPLFSASGLQFFVSSPDSSLGSGQTSIIVLLASHRLDILCLDFFSPEAASLFASLIYLDRGQKSKLAADNSSAHHGGNIVSIPTNPLACLLHQALC